jgi:hypothetical protein
VPVLRTCVPDPRTELSTALCRGTIFEFLELAPWCVRAPDVKCPMGMQRAEFEPFAWWLAKEGIGTDLRYQYATSRELPSQILALVERLGDAVQGDQFREESSPDPPSLLSKLDAIEGNQLLRACRTRLGALRRLQRFGAFA